ncbi:MAG: hypothetical protein AABP62_01625 [Planctomycetota bacterium]
MFPRNRWLALWSICLLWPCAGWAADAKTLEERFRQVEKMSQLERDRLQRNLTEFNKLTPEQQAHYRDLHDRVEQSTGHLSSLLQEYSAWLTTLTPSQRDELNSATDTAQKLALVRQFKNAQEYRPELSTADVPEAPAVDFPMLRQQMFRRFGPALQGPELAAVMSAISKDLDGGERKKPEGESSLKYYRELLKNSIDKSPDGARNWPSADLQQKLEQVPGVKEQLKKRPEGGGRVALIRLIEGGLMKLAIEEFKLSIPSEQDRLEVFNKLSPELQAEINRRRPEEGRGMLDHMYYKQRGDDAPRQMHEFRGDIDRLLNQLGLPSIQQPPFGGDGSRPGPGPGGLRRPQEGRPFGLEGGRPGEPPRGRNDQDRPRGRPND